MKRIILTLSILISGCATTEKPAWYTESNSDTELYIYSVAQGRSLNHAKK
jgi:hypothetical protein